MSKLVALLLALCVFAPAFAAESEDVQVRIFKLFLQRAQEGDMNSQFIIGHRYEIGVGTNQDMDQAYSWYQKAAAQGHPMAQQKLESRMSAAEKAEKARQEAAAEAKVREQAEAAARARAAADTRAREQSEAAARSRAAAAKAAATPKPAAKAPLAATPKVQQREPAEQTYDTLNLVLNGKWFRNQYAAEYLPSATTSCLQAGASDVVCFSGELTRNVGGQSLVFTVKSTLSGFQSNGSFRVNYVYNVMHIDKIRDGGPGVAPEHSDLAVRTGWQEPGINIDCRLNDDRSIACSKDRKNVIQYSRR
jgi:hypothetical protein